MNLYKISITNGRIYAPAMIVEAKDEAAAENIARQKSGLGSFLSWSFVAIEIKQKR